VSRKGGINSSLENVREVHVWLRHKFAVKDYRSLNVLRGTRESNLHVVKELASVVDRIRSHARRRFVS
jgi:hypothetical protein